MHPECTESDFFDCLLACEAAAPFEAASAVPVVLEDEAEFLLSLIRFLGPEGKETMRSSSSSSDEL